MANVSNENLIIASGKYVSFDLQGYTISASSGIIIDNSGKVEINT